MRNHYSALGGVALALTLTLTGCSDDRNDSDAEEQHPTVSPSTSTSVPRAPKTSEEKAALQLRKYLEIRDGAYRARDIDLKALNGVATGDEFLQLQSQVVGLVGGKVRVTGQYEHRLDEPRNRGREILITDCEDRTKVTHKVNGAIRRPDFTAPDGKPLRNPAPVEYTLVRDKGKWKVSDSDLKWDKTC